MAVDFDRTFGKRPTNQAPVSGELPRRKSKFWLNIGYQTEAVDSNGEHRFVSLPGGVALDDQKPFPTSSRDDEYAEFNEARNDLLAQLLEIAHALKPGENVLLNLQLQLRRANEERPEEAKVNNRFIRPLNLLAAE